MTLYVVKENAEPRLTILLAALGNICDAPNQGRALLNNGMPVLFYVPSSLEEDLIARTGIPDVERLLELAVDTCSFRERDIT
jgi:hypothetical protein